MHNPEYPLAAAQEDGTQVVGDPDEIKLFCKALIGEEVEMEALLALLGMRRSEVLGLRWEDVDLEHNCIYVRRVKVPNENNEYVVRSKTKTVESTSSAHFDPQTC